jgi:type II secretory pathway pseudopilin PulG
MVELVIVMVIVGVVAAIAMPRYAAARSQYRVQNACKRLAADYAGLKPTAAAQSGPSTLLMSANADYYRLATSTRDASNTPTTLTQTVDLGVEPYQASFVAVTLAAGSGFGFDAYGNPLGSGSAQLRSSWTLATVTFASTGDVTVGAPKAMSSAQRTALGAK